MYIDQSWSIVHSVTNLYIYFDVHESVHRDIIMKITNKMHYIN